MREKLFLGLFYQRTLLRTIAQQVCSSLQLQLSRTASDTTSLTSASKAFLPLSHIIPSRTSLLGTILCSSFVFVISHSPSLPAKSPRLKHICSLVIGVWRTTASFDKNGAAGENVTPLVSFQTFGLLYKSESSILALSVGSDPS